MHHSALLVVLFRVTTKTSGTFLSVSPLGVRYMDVSHKLHSSRLDWRIFSHNRGGYERSTDPKPVPGRFSFHPDRLVPL